MKILGLDYGSKRIGVAVSDGLMLTAQGRDSIERASDEKNIADIKTLIAADGVSEVVVGLPLNMNGTDSAKTKEVREFIGKLEASLGVPVKAWDERMTSLAAERAMLEGDLSRGKRRKLSDRLAAQMILQNYLDYKKRGTGNGERGEDA